VSPEARGTGIGRKLIEYVYELARAQGCARVHWLTHESNTDAMLLYDRIAERSGFVQYRRAIK
jgi:ribosomal protein S18 acetylase RimI-like enzyme